MKGRILGFDFQAGEGQISGEDGQRYSFVPAEWKATGRPVAGQTVDFEANEGKANSIYVMSGGSGTAVTGEKSKIAAALLALFLGGLGIHKFYLGKNGAGAIMLCCTLLGWILLFIPTLIVWTIAFVEFIIYLVTPDEEFERKYVEGNQAWF